MAAGRVAAAAAEQDRLWNFVHRLYLNQGEENTGYVTPGYLRRLLAAVAGLDVPSGARGGPLRLLTPSSLTAGPFAAAIDQLLGAHR